MSTHLCFLTLAVVWSVSGSAEIVYVDRANTSGVEDGTTWQKAFNTIQEGVDAASAGGGEVWVAAGTYDEGRTSSATGSLVMWPNVEIYGGFLGLAPGGGETLRDERDWAAHPTIIDGANGRGVGLRAIHVVSGENNARLDGFTVTGGDANSGANYPLEYAGGGMMNWMVSPTVANCIFTENDAGFGAGMGNGGDGADPVVSGCTFINNRAHTFPVPDVLGIGGGMGNAYDSSPVVVGCTFEGNTAESFGGGMYNYSASTPDVEGCLFVNNQSTLFGGGMFGYLSVVANVRNCRFFNNTSATGGGMDFEGTSTVNLTNCVFSGNNGTTRCGGVRPYNSVVVAINCSFMDNLGGENSTIRLDATSTLTLRNSIVWSASSTPVNVVSGSATVTYSDVTGGYPGTGNIDTNPLFVNPAGFDLRLNPGSPCIDAGDPVQSPPVPATDLRGVSRPQGLRVDMGAYEYDATEPTFVNITSSPDTARPGETVQITFDSSESLLEEPAVDVNGNPAVVVGGKTAYTYEYTVLPSDQPGSATIEITGEDIAGNVGTTSTDTALTIAEPEIVPLYAWPAGILLLTVGTCLLGKSRKN